MHDARLGARMLEPGEPRHVGLDHEHRVGRFEMRRGVEAAVEGMVLGEVDVGVELLEHRRAERLGQRHERGDGPGIAARRLDDDDRIPRRGEDLRRLVDALRRGHERAGLHHARRIGVLDGLLPLGQHLAGQGEIDGALRLGMGEGEGAVHHRLEVGGAAELVVPLHELAHHGRLVEGLLGPVNGAIAAARVSRLRDGIASRAEEHGHVGAGGVDDAAHRVARAHDDVDHDGLRAGP